MRSRIVRCSLVAGTVLSLALTAAGPASGSPYSTVSRLPGIPAVFSWILQSANTNSLDASLQSQLSSEQKSMFWADTCKGSPGSPSTATACAFGDTAASQSVVLYGDSFALQWVPALSVLGRAFHFKVLVYVRIGCPFADKPVLDYEGSLDAGCLPFRSNVVRAINSMKPAPQLVLMAEDLYRFAPDGTTMTSTQMAAAVATTLKQLAGRRFPIGVILGFPAAKQDPSQCLSANQSDVQACNTSKAVAFAAPADKKFSAAARRSHAFAVNVSMLLCGNSCPDVIHQTLVHADRWHLSANYVESLARSFGSLVGCVGKRAPSNIVQTNGVLTRLLQLNGRPVVTACRAAIAAPFNL
jgi:hypothetical protein